MKEVFIVADNIFSPLGQTTGDNFDTVLAGNTGIRQHQRPRMSAVSFYASLFPEGTQLLPGNAGYYTQFEKLLIASITGALQQTSIDITGSNTLLIISTTKGNISLLENAAIGPELLQRVSLSQSAAMVAKWFGLANKPLVVSNACISGLLALLTGKRLIQSGQYDHVVVAGADVISQFVLSGFQSFQAISDGPCRPFDAARNGINLGEGAGTILLTADKKYESGITLRGGATSNDANHISGPSRTGEELYQAISRAMEEAGVNKEEISFISAHGTATIYNDEMEALAVSLAGLADTPINSLKGYYGHTLGAAGIIESVIAIQSLRQNKVPASRGYHSSGVTKPLAVATGVQEGKYHYCLKTASGFGGCNAALVFNKA